MLDSIEKMDLVIPASRFIDFRRPKSMITRDTQAVAQGLTAPPHIRFEATILQLSSAITNIEKFTNDSILMLTRTQSRLSLPKPKAADVNELEGVVLICNRFHNIVKQLRRRHDKRPTISIADEYDVQDLLHALLLLFYDDVRREEYTPSYAGGSSKMDILLKVQMTVIEVKYDLTNKALREQLAVDVSTYKNHPDCKSLICLGYDPNGRIVNPRGLEADLAKLSTPDLKVMVLVRP
jgi:hypothetical protein